MGHEGPLSTVRSNSDFSVEPTSDTPSDIDMTKVIGPLSVMQIP